MMEDLPNSLADGSEEFKKAYWEWWDNCTPEFRAWFENKNSNMSHVYFYNKVWRNKDKK